MGTELANLLANWNWTGNSSFKVVAKIPRISISAMCVSINGSNRHFQAVLNVKFEKRVDGNIVFYWISVFRERFSALSKNKHKKLETFLISLLIYWNVYKICKMCTVQIKWFIRIYLGKHLRTIAGVWFQFSVLCAMIHSHVYWFTYIYMLGVHFK